MHNPLYASVLQTMVGLLVVITMAADEAVHDESAGDPALYGRYTVIMDNAVLRLDARGRPQGRRAGESLILFFRHDENGWSTVLGLGPEFNLSHHIGRIGDWSIANDHISLTVEMRIGGDPWVPGGPAYYRLLIPQSGADGSIKPLSGTFDGTFNGIEITGTTHSLRRPLSAAAPRGWLGTQELSSESLPPLLFAGLTRDELRVRMEHPVVTAAHAAMVESDSILSHAVLYHYSGFDGHAQRVRTLVEDRLAERGPGAQDTGLVWADRLRDVAYGYALMADTWETDFRDRVERYLDWITGRLLYRPHSLSRRMDWSPGSPQQAHFRAAAGMSALALLGQPGVEPSTEVEDTEQPRTIPALAERVPHSLLAVHQDLRLGEIPDHWLVAGPIPDPLNAGHDMLAHMGGPEEFHLRVDDDSTVRSGSQHAAFEVLPEASFWQHQGRQNIEFTEFFARNYANKADGFYHTAYYASVVNNKKPMRVRFLERTGGAQVQAWLNGYPIRNGDYLDLESGSYALLVRAHAFSTNDWGKMWMSPAFVSVNNAEMRKDLRRRSEIRALMNAEHEEDLRYFREQGGADPRWWRLAEVARVHMERYSEYAVGSGGWLFGGSVAIHGLNHLLEYRLLHGRRFGHTLGDGNNLDAIVLRMVMQSALREDSLRMVMDTNNGSLLAGHIARIWPILNEEVQPGVLWAWNHLLGWDPAGEAAPSIPADDSAVFTFLHYPTVLTAADPASALGRQWLAEDAGVAIMRNGFAADEAIICQVHWGSSMANQPHRGVPGDIWLYGYGHHWSRPAFDPGSTPSQASATVLQIKRQHLAVLEPGQRRQWVPRPDGGGLLSLDLSASYQSQVLHRGREQDLRDVFHRLLPDRLQDIGITGQRTVAVDYSGRSGAPALLVIVDQLSVPDEDGPGVAWQWNLPEGVVAEGEVLQVNEHGFRLRQGAGQLDMHLISQQPFSLSAHFNEQLRLPGAREGQRVHAMRASGDFAAPFIAVATLGPHREAITVSAQRRGQRWTIRVGDQEIRVRGDNISFADAE